MNTFGERLNQLRKDQNINQQEIANKLNVTRATISSWETGRTQPGNETILELSKILNTTVGYLLGETNISSKTNLNALENLDDAQCFFRFDTSELNDKERDDFEKQLEAYAKFLTGNIKNKRGE